MIPQWVKVTWAGGLRLRDERCNLDGCIEVCGACGKVHVVEFNSSTPFEEQLHTVAGTGVFVSVHTSNLANAPFLQPGSAVIEIIQRNWIWDNLDRSFQVRCCSMHSF